MGRKIEIKKIQDNVKCQVTFSKRRTSLIKKAEQISILCDVNVALIGFSPAGRITKFCTRERIEDMLDLYVSLPTEKRLSHLKNVQEKMRKLKALATIKTEDGMSNYLNDQIENLKLHLEKNQVEVRLAEADLRYFELNPGQEASLHQLSWCERNLQHYIKKVEEIKKEKLLMENEGAMPCLYSEDGTGQHHMQFESWSNNEYKYPDNLFSEMLGKGKGKEVEGAFGASIPTPYGLHQSVVSENEQKWSLYDLLQLEQVNVNDADPQQCGNDYASDKQIEPNTSIGNFPGESRNFLESHMPSYPTGFLQSNGNNVISSLADTCREIPMVENRPNLVVDHMDLEANGEGNEIYNEENEDADNKKIGSPPPSAQEPPSTSGFPTYLYDDFLPCEHPLGDESWTQKLGDIDMWGWDNLISFL